MSRSLIVPATANEISAVNIGACPDTWRKRPWRTSRPPRLYLGADGIDPEIGVMTPHLQEAELNAHMIRISRQVVVVADSSKLIRRNISLIAKVGMSLRDPDGTYVMLDDERFEPIMARLQRDHLVLLGHQAEPRNCWLPLEQMTVKSDREYFTEHPQYYMYKHPEMPSHGAILAARDRMLTAHPGLRFDAVHLASFEWDVDEVAAFLDRFPNANVDLAARMVHLEFQASSNPARVRQFLIRYQDRVLYGSDDAYGPKDSDPHALDDVHSGWVLDWRFLVTPDQLHSPDFPQPFNGLHLPRKVIDKIYRGNAQAMFRGAWQARQYPHR